MKEIVVFLKAYKAPDFMHFPMSGCTEEAPLAAFVKHVQEYYKGG
jgi:hypothetical protein